MDVPGIDVRLMLNHLALIAVAFALALPVGWERERSDRSAGASHVPAGGDGQVLAGHPEGTARVIEGLMTGIGFIGGGAILKSEGAVRGTATAASVWNTGAIGAAVAFGRFEIAIVLAVINFAALRWLVPFKTDRPS
jgi:putative Mg2+ transporter-C (MgtC) family protein